MARLIGVLAVIALIGLGFLWLMAGGRDDMLGLDRSPIGTDGLVQVLTDAGVKLALAAPGTAMKAGDIGLRILPLYDMDLDDDRPETLGDTTLRTLARWQLRNKLYQAKTLVILPKWRWAVTEKGIAAPETAIPVEDFRLLLDQMGLGGTRLQRAGPVFAGFAGKGGQVAEFLQQSFDPASLPQDCVPWWYNETGALLIACTDSAVGPVYYLADPDMMNNHGLTLADNAGVAVRLISDLQPTPGKLVYLDRLAANYVVSDGGDAGQDYTRTADDLWRFFKPPLGTIWAMLAILLALFLWRGGRRFGPVATEGPEGPERARAEVIASRARLIRLTGQDAAMVADYVKTDLLRMAEAAFGPGRGEVARLYPLLARRDATAAAQFQGLAADLMRAAPATPSALRRQLQTYHQLQRTLTHDA